MATPDQPETRAADLCGKSDQWPPELRAYVIELQERLIAANFELYDFRRARAEAQAADQIAASAFGSARSREPKPDALNSVLAEALQQIADQEAQKAEGLYTEAKAMSVSLIALEATADYRAGLARKYADCAFTLRNRKAG